MSYSHTRPSELGFCRHCLANVQQQRSVRTPIGRWLDWLTLGIGRYLGIGSWVCASCGSAKWLFPPARRDASVYDPRRSSSRNQPASDIERIGNYLDAEVSLVTRAGRNRQYTPRFRERVVESLLTGETSFSEMRKKLDLSDLDLQDWIARYHEQRLRGTEGPPAAAGGDVLDGTVVHESPTEEPAPAKNAPPRRAAK